MPSMLCYAHSERAAAADQRNAVFSQRLHRQHKPSATLTGVLAAPADTAGLPERTSASLSTSRHCQRPARLFHVTAAAASV